jgi:hypothetical protein
MAVRRERQNARQFVLNEGGEGMEHARFSHDVRVVESPQIGRSSPPMTLGSVVSSTFTQRLNRYRVRRLTKDSKSAKP